MAEYTAPAVVVSVAAFLLLSRLDRRPGNLRYHLLASAAIAAPLLLALAGWDWNRWTFFAVGNFFIVAWLWLGNADIRPVREFGPAQWAVLVFMLLLATHLESLYFGWAVPRSLSWASFCQFWDDVRSGVAFKILTD